MQRTLTIRIPLQNSDHYDIIGEIDRNNVNLTDLIQDRFEDVLLSVETGDKVSS